MGPRRPHTAVRRAAPKEEEPEDDSFPSSSGTEGEEDSSSDEDSFPEVSDEGEEEDGGAEDGGVDSEGMEDDDEAVKEITVEFEFFGPEEKDFLGLKSLLANYLNGAQFDSSGLVDTIIAEVGLPAVTGMG